MEEKRDWHVAVVGSGPAGLYGAEALAKKGAFVDVFEKLFAPFGLVRYGVAPDHQKIKKTAKIFERTLNRPDVRFFGNVELGKDIMLGDLLEHYDQVLIAVGSSTARRLSVPGEELAGSVSATDFVAWYNGHPDYGDWMPPLDERVAVIVGMGNVAVDVARVLMQDPGVLARTDISEPARRALAASRVQEVFLLGRRGPDQAAFDLKELRALAELPGVRLRRHGYRGGVHTPKGRAVLDLPPADLTTPGRKIVLRFCTSPTELRGDGRVEFLRLETNDLVESAGRLRAEGSGHFELMEAGLVVRAIGYHGKPLPQLPFHESTGTISNRGGRVIDDASGQPIAGLYVAGWIKRGPTGLIGSNKICARETVDNMEADLSHLGPSRNPAAVEALLAKRGVSVVDRDIWRKLDTLEQELGRAHGRVREKFLSWEEAHRALRSSAGSSDDA